jgi:hypothetical protein
MQNATIFLPYHVPVRFTGIQNEFSNAPWG